MLKTQQNKIIEFKKFTMPNTTPLKAVWNSKLGVRSSGVGYANSRRIAIVAQNQRTGHEKQFQATHLIIDITLNCNLTRIC